MQKRNTFAYNTNKKGHSTKGRGSNLQFGWEKKQNAALPPLQETAGQINLVRIGYIDNIGDQSWAAQRAEGAGQGGNCVWFCGANWQDLFSIKNKRNEWGRGAGRQAGEEVREEHVRGGGEEGKWAALSFLACAADIQHFIGSVFYVWFAIWQ